MSILTTDDFESYTLGTGGSNSHIGPWGANGATVRNSSAFYPGGHGGGQGVFGNISNGIIRPSSNFGASTADLNATWEPSGRAIVWSFRWTTARSGSSSRYGHAAIRPTPPFGTTPNTLFGISHYVATSNGVDPGAGPNDIVLFSKYYNASSVLTTVTSRATGVLADEVWQKFDLRWKVSSVAGSAPYLNPDGRMQLYVDDVLVLDVSGWYLTAIDNNAPIATNKWSGVRFGPYTGYIDDVYLDNEPFVDIVEAAASSAGTATAAATGGTVTDATFDNASLLIGLTWLELTTPSGLQPAPFTDRPLPDPAFYYRGWKAPRVIQWGRIRRALSGFNGEYETSDFSITCSDIDRFLRGLDDANDLVNASAVVRMITDDGRRALQTPRVVYRGVVRDIAPLGGLQYRITIKDPYAEVFYASGQTTQLPRRTIGVEDFPNCAQTLVASSASGYQTSASALAGVDQVSVDSGLGQFASGDKITFAGHTTIYTVSTSSWSDPESSVTFTPALTDPVGDNEAITVRPSHTITASVGQRVPILYGHLTDRKLEGGIDLGDGQCPVIYVGDRELSDGQTWGEFVVCGHACYGGGGSRPIVMLYFWNEALDDLAAAPFGFYHDGVLLSDFVLNDLATEAGSGGRIAIPGYGNWSDLGFTQSYIDDGGHRYTKFYLRGIYRDWALGIAPAPDNLGGVPLAIDAYGCETVGDGTGELIENLLPQYLHAITNWCPPSGEGYQSGAWLTIPSWPDGTPMIDAASFVAADTQSGVYVSGGFRGDFLIGANNEAISARQLLARFNVSAGVDSGFNRDSQYFVSMINRDLGTTTLQPALGWVRDIFSKTFAVESRTRELYTAIPYRHTQDYLRRDPSGWRSVESGETEVEDPAMSTLYGAKTGSPEVDLYMVRGKNRDSDADEYSRGTETAAAVLALKLARWAHVQHIATLQTGPAGFNYELGDVLNITHYEGVGPAGWVEVPCRIERIEIDPSNFTTTLEVYDLRPVLEL